MTSVMNPTGITPADLSYIRRADDFYAVVREGQNYLGCVKRGRMGDAFSEDVRVEIPIGGNGASGYFVSVWQFPWNTHPFRAGDELSWYWYPDASTNEYMREAGLHGDTLYLDLRRGKKQWRYLVAVSVCHDNSARMCRGA